MRNYKHIAKMWLIFALIATLISCNRLDTEQSRTQSTVSSYENIGMEDESIVDYNVFQTTSKLKYCDGYLYFYVGSSYGDSEMTLYRYNVQTGNITTVCADPLCQHSDKECPFYALDIQYAVYDDKIIYDRMFFLKGDIGDGDAYTESVIYDLMENTLTKYSTSDGFKDVLNDRELYSGNYRFFYNKVIEEETQESKLALCRMNLDSGEIVVLDENASTAGLTLTSYMVFAVGEYLYFTDGKELYRTDMDLQEKTTVLSGSFDTQAIYTDGEYIYWGSRETKDSNILTLYRAKLDGSDQTALGIQTYSFCLTENYIYYKNIDRYTHGKDKRSGSNGEEIGGVGTVLCRASHDGSNQEELFSFWQGDTFYLLRYPCYVNNFVYCLYDTYTDADRDGAIRDDEYFESSDYKDYTILRIDLNTGEMDFIRCGTENRETP